MNKFIALLTKEKGKTAMNKWKKDAIVRALYYVHKKLGQFVFHAYSLTSLNKDLSVLLKDINILTSSSVKYKNNGHNFPEN